MTATPSSESAEAASFTRAGLWHGMRLTLPYTVSALPFGIAFGAAAVGVGVSPGEAVLMSGLVFAGSAQFAVLSLWTGPLPLLAITLTTLLVNARHVVMGAALQPFFSTLPRRLLLLLAGGMTDGGWAITLQEAMRGRRDAGILLGTIVMQWPVWVGGTAIGASIGATGIDPKRWALDLVIAGVFTTAVIGLYRGRGDILPWLAAVGGTLAALAWLPGNWYVLVGAVCAGFVGLLRRDD